MSEADYIIGFSSNKFSYGILTTWAAVVFGSLIQKRKGKLNYISFLTKKSLSTNYIYLNEKNKDRVFIITSIAKISSMIAST